ncbi:UbiA prenyltransferase family protein [Dactylococcopsis salina]|uniref:UbiA prenyltransferase family protein n=1 Tax=Dactylococcopsis salina (strain PCC 8305) TaxID=13035 RepID=K9YRZ2_DACS8|nr:UbiA family prenyltransferase [Dactylococcopsis salina]AFZ49664.1 UbiA prenyltransferase family protein [Dactylococcopsis salina PCC 8305]
MSLEISPQQEWLRDRALQLIIYPSIWVALALASLTAFSQAMMGLESDWRPILFVFLVALIPYNLDRLFDAYVQKSSDEKAQAYFRSNFGLLALLILAVGGVITLLWFAPNPVRYVSLAVVFPLVYGAPIFPIPRAKKWRWYRLKDIPGSKAWIVCTIITYAAIALPLAYAKTDFDTRAALTTCFIFAFEGSNANLFDVRDLESDARKGVLTLPLMVGLKNSRIVLTVMNLLMLGIVLFYGNASIVSFYPEIFSATGLMLILIWTVDEETPLLFYDLIIDGLLFLPAIVYYSFQFIIF